MSEFCFEDSAAAKTAADATPKSRTYKITNGDSTYYVVALTKDMAVSRYALEILGVEASADRVSAGGRPASTGPKVNPKMIKELEAQAAEAKTPEEAFKLLGEAKSLKVLLEEKRAAKKLAKEAANPPLAPA